MTPTCAQLFSRRDRILAFISEYVEGHGYPPTVREIAAAVGLLSSSTAHQHLDVLEREGAIRRDRTKPRALRVLVPASDHHEET